MLKTIKQSSFLRKAVALLAAALNGFPQRHLTIIGITGSNGKTTTSYLLRHLLIKSGKTVGLIGTSGYWLDNNSKLETPALGTTPVTTPEPFHLFRLLKQMVQKQTNFCILEVSSAGLKDWRIFGINFKTAILTSLSPTYHVALHGNFENYKNCKRRLFEILSSQATAILPYDNPFFEEFKKHTQAKVISYGFSSQADVHGRILKQTWQNTSLIIETKQGNLEVTVPLKGDYNCLNIFSSVAYCLELGLPLTLIKEGLETLPPIAGRFEIIETTTPFKIVIDKANTTEAFNSLLKAVKNLPFHNLILVYGNFHDYSLEVREELAQLALANADLTIITTDDPKEENPEQGLKDFINYAKRHQIDQQKYLAILERKEALKTALQKAQADDLILILGRGDEKLMNLGGKIIEFDDRKIVKDLLSELNLSYHEI
ncbi:MAG: UDP-N-acetylmuramoyl-L-alanyl-D-glutamate--L-lysine ligase [Patescibacteria group bacterium]|nr:UDP-N-acetylmuramoyl-L-alanyl-D-glutamate--L-lysine ligase [Patescibacteria group bacterium]